MTESQHVLLETIAARDQAQRLLRSLIEAKSVSERNQREMGQSDNFKRVTGKSSLDNAIASAQRMIDTLDRAVCDYKRTLTGVDLDAARCAASAFA